MNAQKVRIVRLTTDQMSALRLVLKLEWMRMTDECITEAIQKQQAHSTTTQEIISFGESYIVMDTPLYEALRELHTTGNQHASVTFFAESFDVLHDIIQHKYKNMNFDKVDAPEQAVAIIKNICMLFDGQRYDLDQAFAAASESVQAGGEVVFPKHNKTLLN